MTIFTSIKRRAPGLALFASVVLLAACGGGGNGGGNPVDPGTPVVMSISVEGITDAIHSDGVDNPGGVPAIGAYLNGRITITFGGPVDPATIPAPGVTQNASLQVFDAMTLVPAMGSFAINPANTRQVFFTPLPPASASVCMAGLQADTSYRLVVADLNSATSPAVNVGGTALERGADALFETRACAGTDPLFLDPNSGPPSVMGSNPAAGSTTAQSALSGFPTNSIITVDIDEALDPRTVSVSTVIIVNRTINATLDLPVAAAVSMIQYGLVPGNPNIARILIMTAAPLADGHEFAVRFAGVTDLSGNQLSASPDAIRFGIVDEMNGVASFFSDDFSTTANRQSLSSAIAWPGTSVGDPNSGRIGATFGLEITGNGLDGVGSFSTGMTINSDNQVTPGDPEAQPGTYNFTTLQIGNGINTILTFQSLTDVAPGEVNWPLRLRATISITIATNTTIRCRGRQNPMLGGGNFMAETNTINGGWGGPGAGRGGAGSPISTMGVDNDFGLPGEGAHVGIIDPSAPGGDLGNVATTFPQGTHDAFFGGGGAGESGYSISSFPMFGAAGGGGGSASGMAASSSGLFTFNVATTGETKLGVDNLGAGAPIAGQPGQAMAYMIPPLLEACGGSGGGGGGDRRHGVGIVLGSRAGGAGAGGGGGIRISAGSQVTIGTMVTIDCRGGEGGRVTPPSGFGGGGSGGSILVQSSGQITLAPAVSFNTDGGLGGASQSGVPTATLDGEGGRGGSGVVQMEDLNGGFITTFNSMALVNGEGLAQPLSFIGGMISGTATSMPIDTGSSLTDYTAATAILVPTATGTATIMLIGIAEDPANPGNPATSATDPSGFPQMVGPVDISQYDQLDGFRYFQFIVTTTYQTPSNFTTPGPFPYVDDLRVDFVN